MQPSPSCGEKQSLTERLNQARLLYAEATTHLETMESGEFKEALRKAHQAKDTYESARDALEAHNKEHGC
ncbi:MAG TPA: hypothetical protein VFB82_15485 [Blastocatellia bacterium]|nr:hypothetical protein [Blastocatellia bacterium]